MNGLFYISYAILWLLVGFQSLVILGLARATYRASNGSAAGVPVASNGHLSGGPVPKFRATDVSGNLIDETVFANRVSALLFVAPDCTSCLATLDELDALRVKVKGSVAVICRAGRDECEGLRVAYNLGDIPVIVDEDLKVSEVFDVHVAPTAVLIGANGYIQTYGHPWRAGDFADLLAQSEADSDADGSKERVAASHV